MTNKVEDKKETVRVERVSLKQQRSCTFAQRPGYKRRVVSDEPGRIEMFLRAGWVPVKGQENNLCDRLSHTESQIGSVVRKVINRGHDARAHHGILMEIPIELFNADQIEKDKVVDSMNAAIYSAKTGQDYGKVKVDGTFFKS